MVRIKATTKCYNSISGEGASPPLCACLLKSFLGNVAVPSRSRSGAVNATALYLEKAFPIAAGKTSVLVTVNASRHAGYYAGNYTPANSGSYQVNAQQHPPGSADVVLIRLILAND